MGLYLGRPVYLRTNDATVPPSEPLVPVLYELVSCSQAPDRH
jgi:hypothetical protein